MLDKINGNLIISGAFGLFRKDVVIAAGGYDSNTLGEDMELVVKLHVYCRNNNRPYSLRYEPTAVCWSQAPGSLKDLAKQRRRWHLFECLHLSDIRIVRNNGVPLKERRYDVIYKKGNLETRFPFQTVDKVKIKLSLCILNEILCRGYFCHMNYVTIEG